jgi:hypothetical protein
VFNEKIAHLYLPKCYNTESYQLYLLSENHETKKKIISFMNEQNSNIAIEFILKNTEIKLEAYNPNKG